MNEQLCIDVSMRFTELLLMQLEHRLIFKEIFSGQLTVL